jgi:MoCo/4Fe-4S cofactor protein with predicted Tat translocation signal
VNGTDDQNQPLTELGAHLAGLRGRRYWRSLEELAGTADFQKALAERFPAAASLWSAPLSRREALRLMAAALSLAGLGACSRKPTEEIVPHVKPPEELIPGKPVLYATAFLLDGFATGVLVESHDGRPIKLEGNPLHPASRGATSAFAQATILELYDPERSQVILQSRRISTWDAFVGATNAQIDRQRPRRGAGLRILSGHVTSPTVGRQMRGLLQQFPEAKWCQYEAVSRSNFTDGARRAFDQEVHSVYRFDKAEVILALDADFLFVGPAAVRYARDFAARRKLRGNGSTMNRLYVAEPTPSITGAMADHRVAVSADKIGAMAHAIARRLGVEAVSSVADPLASYTKWIDAVADDLKQHRGTSLVLAGEAQPPEIHALAHAMNQSLGNTDATVAFIDPVTETADGRMLSLEELTQEMAQGAVEALFIFGANPVFTAPADVGFGEALAKVPYRVHLGLYVDETAALCHWHVPEAHVLESWGDAKSYDGTATIIQPLIAPLYAGKTAVELLALLSGAATQAPYDIVQAFWRARVPNGFDTWWRRALHDGVVPQSAAPAKPVRLKAPSSAPAAKAETVPSADHFELVFRPDPTIWDGRFANNAWLQELPKPLTKLVWDNAALMSPRTAQRLALKNGDGVELQFDGRRLRAPVWINPGQADDSVTIELGYGRSAAGRIGNGVGFNAYRLRTSDHQWFGRGLTLKRTGERFELATTQEHHRMEGRSLIRTGTLAEYLRHPDFVHDMGHEPPPELTLYPPQPAAVNAWGMAIDTNICIGCNACVVACQAENNIPVVGKSQVAAGREMHWIRVDRYYMGDAEHPEIVHQPVPCMQCENAPCESVCPVGATVHSSEGLNDMVYNRCVGTRYCSNNCPYKVRRFNFFQYADYQTPSLKLGRNPEVTVRSRGVMEKCTYCVQRINRARIEAKKAQRPLRDGEILTACQQVCPTEAIVFGDIKNAEAAVTQLKAQPLNYTLLAELNTRPRTSYLARLKNPNPKIGES